MKALGRPTAGPRLLVDEQGRAWLLDAEGRLIALYALLPKRCRKVASLTGEERT